MQEIHRAVSLPGLKANRWCLAALAVAVITTVAACGGADDAGDQTAPTSQAKGTAAPDSMVVSTTVVSTTASTTTRSTTTTLPTTTLPTTTTAVGAPEVATFNVGERATYDDGSSVQVFSVEQPYVDPTSIIGLPEGKEAVSIHAEVCLGSRATTTFAAKAWTAYPASGGALPERLTTRFPAFLGSGPVTSGSCQKGYVGALTDVGTPAAWVVWTQPGWEPVRFKV